MSTTGWKHSLSISSNVRYSSLYIIGSQALLSSNVRVQDTCAPPATHLLVTMATIVLEDQSFRTCLSTYLVTARGGWERPTGVLYYIERHKALYELPIFYSICCGSATDSIPCNGDSRFACQTRKSYKGQDPIVDSWKHLKFIFFMFNSSGNDQQLGQVLHDWSEEQVLQVDMS